MIPTTAVLHGSELISEAVARSNRALCDAIDTVHVRSIQLPDPMEMNRCAVELELVDDSHLYKGSIIQRDPFPRSRYLPTKSPQQASVIIVINSTHKTCWDSVLTNPGARISSIENFTMLHGHSVHVQWHFRHVQLVLQAVSVHNAPLQNVRESSAYLPRFPNRNS